MIHENLCPQQAVVGYVQHFQCEGFEAAYVELTLLQHLGGSWQVAPTVHCALWADNIPRFFL